VQSLAMVAEVVHGAPYRFEDPARFSLAHGGKDRHPYAVPIKVYDETIRVLKSAVQQAKLGRRGDPGAQAPRRAGARPGADRQRPDARSLHGSRTAASPALGGRSVFGWEQDLAKSRKAR